MRCILRGAGQKMMINSNPFRINAISRPRKWTTIGWDVVGLLTYRSRDVCTPHDSYRHGLRRMDVGTTVRLNINSIAATWHSSHNRRSRATNRTYPS